MGWYITIQDWMRKLGLKGNELIVFAFLNGYSQEGQGYYYGGLAYLQEVCGIGTRATAIHILQQLTDDGLVTREECGRVVAYKIDQKAICSKIERIEIERVQKLNGSVQKLNSTCIEIEHNNKREENIINNNNIIIRNSEKFDFKEELVMRGVPGDLADDWLKVRKTKRASNTKTALEAVLRETAKASISLEEAVRVAAANSWQGFRAEWYFNLQQRHTSPSGYGRQSAFESALQAKRDLANLVPEMPDGRGRIDEQ